MGDECDDDRSKLGHEPSVYPPDATPWERLTYSSYRQALRCGDLVPGIVFERHPAPGVPTAVCVHGWRGTPANFRTLGVHVRATANLAFFVYDDHSRLADTAELLRHAVRALPGPCLFIGFSMGALLPAYASATDVNGDLHRVAALYLNPLLGGTRYADADPVLAMLDQIPGLQWLHELKRLFRRRFLPESVEDLDPRSRFQQAIFGEAASRPTLRERTIIVWTEDDSSRYVSVAPRRVPAFFGCSRDELLGRLGRVAALPPGHARGHTAPINDPSLVLPLLHAAIRDWM